MSRIVHLNGFVNRNFYKGVGRNLNHVRVYGILWATLVIRSGGTGVRVTGSVRSGPLPGERRENHLDCLARLLAGARLP